MDIRQIAKKAGVSVTTVSRVQNHPELVAEATREKVQAVIDEFNYTPNWFARGMNLGKAETIGIIVPDISSPSYMKIIKGIEDIMSKSGYITFICQGSYNVRKEEDSLDKLLKRNTDGLIIISSSISRDKLLSIKSRKIPIVSIGENYAPDEIDTVKIDYEKVSYKATKHLVDIGYDKIAIINGPEENRETIFRVEGYKKALQSKNIKINKDYIINSEICIEEAYLLTKKLMELENPPRAIFATNDVFTVAVMIALRESKIKVPEEVAVIGFDNIKFSKNDELKLTKVINPLYDKGVLGAKLLIDIIKNPYSEHHSAQEIILDTKIEIGESCGYDKR